MRRKNSRAVLAFLLTAAIALETPAQFVLASETTAEETTAVQEEETTASEDGLQAETTGAAETSAESTQEESTVPEETAQASAEQTAASDETVQTSAEETASSGEETAAAQADIPSQSVQETSAAEQTEIEETEEKTENLVSVLTEQFDLSGGIHEQVLSLEDEEQSRQARGYAIVLDQLTEEEGVALEICVGGDGVFAPQTGTEAAAAKEEESGCTVLAAVSLGSLDADTLQPADFVAAAGQTCGSADAPYFALLQDGSFVIRRREDSPEDVQSAVGGTELLLEEGEKCALEEAGRQISSAVGITAEGSLVFYTLEHQEDGAGVTQENMAELMAQMGCVSALGLNNAGYPAVSTRRAQEDSLTLRSRTKDGEEEKAEAVLLFCAAEEQDTLTRGAVLSEEEPEDSMESICASAALLTAEEEKQSRYNTVAETTYTVAPGIEEKKYVMNTSAGNEQIMAYTLTIDLSGGTSGIAAGYKDADPAAGWGLQNTTLQAAALEKKRGMNVVGGVNGDYFNMATGEPIGVLVMNGVQYHAAGYEPYFAILKDGTAEIRDAYTPVGDDVAEAIGGPSILIRDGKRVDDDPAGLNPYSAVGIKADGSVVMIAVDGRQAPVSVGITHNDLADILLDMGCVDALRLDGGGSMTFVSQREGSSDLVIRNSPSDGVERSVSTALFVYSSAVSDGKFNHAVLEPNNELYTPGTSVTFTAVGVDAAGSAAELPSDITWALAEDSQSLGTIDQNGVFVSSGETGTVTVNLLSGGSVVGTTGIEISVPDSISFRNAEISAAFDADVDLNLIVKAGGRDINYKDGDFEWTLSNELLGVMNGNVFHSSDGDRQSGTITATSVHNSEVSGTVSVIVGKEPTIAWDFEDPEYFTIDEDGSNFYTANAGRGAKQSAELVTIDSGEPVRFGNRSLKINYDFTAPPTGTDGAYFGMTEDIDIPGSPTGIGVWVYAPEGTGNFWLRGYIKDADGKTNPVDFTLQTSQATEDTPAGIYWEGWKYCEADLTGWNAPFKLAKGLTLRIMYVPGINMGTTTAGSLYFDNLQFVYGANDSDIDSPVIDTLTANGETLTDGMVFDTDTINFETTFHDVENKYTTGIDFDTVNAYIDGNNVKDLGIENALDEGSSKLYLYNVKLTKGAHSVRILVRDKFGNEAIETRYFTITGEEALENPISFTAREGSVPTLGKDFVLDLTAKQAEDIASVTTQVVIDRAYESTYQVVFSDAYEGTVSYNKITRYLTIEASRKEDASGSGEEVILSVIFPIPSDTKEGTVLNYTVRSGKYTTVSSEEGSFSDSPKKLTVQATYTISADVMVHGANGRIFAADQEGNPVSGIGVFNAGTGEEIGKTDADGILLTDALCQEAGTYEIYASDEEGGLSFRKKIICSEPAGNEEGLPYNILNSTVKNPSAEKNIIWMSNPNASGETAQVQYAEKALYEESGEEALQTVSGTASTEEFTAGTACAARVNSVCLTGLRENTSYVYRVGDGTLWSDIAGFTTGTAGKEDTSFFIIADIQSDDLTKTQAILDQVKDGAYDFGIQTGDGVDSAINYTYWDEFINLFGIEQMAGKDVIHVLGNHEYEGNLSGSIANRIYNLPGSKYYSVTYGNVYVAVINYTRSQAELQEALDWLAADAAASSARWKVLTMHQPSYYTNTTGGNAYIHDMVPSAAEAAGIDFVFSGHDHSYVRTEPLTAGEVDSENGVVYFICGSTGEKSYSVVNNPDFHFAKINDSYDAIYLSVEATEKSFTVTAMESDGTVIDTYVKEDPCAKGHTYVYDSGNLVCTVCGAFVAAADSDYTGLLTDTASGRRMYLKNGIIMTGVQEYAGKRYCFDENGLAYDGAFTYVGTTVVLKDGELVSCTDPEVTFIVGMGECEDGLRWLITNNSVLRIDGTGDMRDYTMDNAAPWKSRQAWVHTAYIGKDITRIGKYGLFALSEMREIVFEEGSRLKSIGAQAFHFNKLTAITLPETVTEIGNYAFADDTKLEEIVIPQGVSKLSYAAFQGCKALTKATIAGAVSLIEDKVFEGCGALTIYGIRDSVTHLYAEKNSIPFVAVADAVYEGTLGENLKWSYTAGVLTVSGEGSMADSSGSGNQPWNQMENGIRLQNRILQVVIGKDVTGIGAYTFFDAANLSSVVFEEGSVLQAVGKHAFQNSGIESITLPESAVSFGNYCFAGTVRLTEAVIPGAAAKLPYAAFQGCSLLKKAVLPETLTLIEENVFEGCTSLEIWGYTDSLAETYAQSKAIPFHAVGSAAYEGAVTDTISWRYQDGTLTISGEGRMPSFADGTQPWAEAYTGVKLQSRIKKVVIGKGIENIGAYAFFGASNLTEAVFEAGSTLKSVEKHAFQGSGLMRLDLPGSVSEYGNYAFADCRALKEFTVSSHVTELPYAAFQNDENLEKIVIPKTVTGFGSKVFDGCTKLTVYCEEGSSAASYASGRNIPVQTVDSTAAYSGRFGENLKWEFDDGVLTISGNGSIPDYTAAGGQPWAAAGEDGSVNLHSQIETLVIGKGVESIGAYAFFNATAVKEVVFEEGSALTEIKKHSMQNLSVTEISMPSSVAALGNYAFAGCNEAKRITVSEGVSFLPYACFAGCTSLETLAIPESVTFIEEDILKESGRAVIEGVQDSTAHYYAEKWGIGFRSNGQKARYSGELGTGVTWEYCDGVMTFAGEGVIPDYANYYSQPWYRMDNTVKLQRRIRKVVIGSGVEEIGAYAFFDAVNLEEIVFEEGSTLRRIGKHSMQHIALTQIALPDSVTVIERYAFEGAAALKEVELPAGMETLCYAVFQNCSSLTKAVVPESVTVVEDNAFDSCPLLTIYGQGDGPVDYYAEKNGIAFTATSYISYGGSLGDGLSWEYVNGVMRINGSGAMPDYPTYSRQPWYKTESGVKLLPRIRRLVIGKNVARIGAYAFFDAVNLSEVVFEDGSGLISVGKHALQNCCFETITLPETVTSIESYAFAGNDALCEISFPEDAVLGVHICDGFDEGLWE